MNNKKSRNLLFRTIILSFLTNLVLVIFILVVQEIYNQDEIYEQLDTIGIYIGIATAIIALINLYIEQEISKEKVKLLEENVNSSPNQLEVYDLVNIAKTITNFLKDIGQNSNLSSSDKEEIESLLDKLNDVQLSTESYQLIKVWLEDTENLKNIAKTSGDRALKNNSYKIYEMQFMNKNKSKELLYYSIYYCLQWIKKSFIVGDYLSTARMPKISDQQRTISALNIIKTEILTKLPKEFQKELEIYFDELVKLIPSL